MFPDIQETKLRAFVQATSIANLSRYFLPPLLVFLFPFLILPFYFLSLYSIYLSLLSPFFFFYRNPHEIVSSSLHSLLSPQKRKREGEGAVEKEEEGIEGLVLPWEKIRSLTCQEQKQWQQQQQSQQQQQQQQQQEQRLSMEVQMCVAKGFFLFLSLPHFLALPSLFALS